MEAELRCILGQALDDGQEPEPNLAETTRRRLAPLRGVELEPQPPVKLRAAPTFD